jgi:transglutaminase-like putative cysteine protease
MSTYRIQHTTTYTYESDVTGSYGQFHLRPRDLEWQHCLDHEVVVTPEPADMFRHEDVYGNTKTYYHVLTPHSELVITGISTVEISDRLLDPDRLALPWESARPAMAIEAPDSWRATDFTFSSPMIDVPDGVSAYAAASFTPGRAIGEAAIDLMHRVHADFTYKSGSTTVATRVSDLLERKMGVCQDYAHFTVACLRSLGLAGRYVSGYLATVTPPGKERVVGADASHAWVGVWVPGAGWLYLDPTNNRVTDVSHATVAFGRDYSDVPPVKGVIFTESKKSKLKVGVDMARL